MSPENMPVDILSVWLEVWASEGYEMYWKPVSIYGAKTQ